MTKPIIEGRVVFLSNLSLDDVPEIELAALKSSPREVLMLTPAGEWERTEWKYQDGLLTVSAGLRTLRPAVLLIK